jgi:predicted transglutaminase-like cysteine proteinase
MSMSNRNMPTSLARGPVLRALLAICAILAVQTGDGFAETVLPKAPGPPAAAPGFPAIFGAAETPNSNLGAFRRWTGVVERTMHEWLGYHDPCATRFAGRCTTGEWRQLVARLADRPRREKIDRVNAFFNRMPYALDPAAWGANDYWATPLQFLSRSGDCEDYAIAKFVTLRQLGIGSDEMRIVVVDDTNLRVAHAVLVVAEEDRLLVLDNQVPDVLDSRRILHYRPVFSLNENRWWLHRKQ